MGGGELAVEYLTHQSEEEMSGSKSHSSAQLGVRVAKHPSLCEEPWRGGRRVGWGQKREEGWLW